MTGTSYTDTAVTSGTTYYYEIKAVNSAATSGPSNEASATPITGLPSAPTALTAAGGNTQVSLTWTAGSGATSYNIYRGTLPNGENPTPIATGVTSTSYVDSTVANGPTDYYRVASVNSVGTSSYSNEASATPGPTNAPAPPTSLAAAAGNGQVTLTWSASSGATSYNIYRGTSSGNESTVASPSGVTSTSYTVTGLANGKTYYFRISAVNSYGVSGYSNETNATPNSVSIPPAPSGLTASVGNAQVTLSWTASTGATSYNLYRGTSPGGENATAVATGITSTSYANTSLINGTTYYFTVTAVNSAGTSGYSNEVSATPNSAAGLGTTDTPTMPLSFLIAFAALLFGLASRFVPGAKPV